VRSRLRSDGGGRRAPHPVDGWESLTRTERNVASNVSEGLTNRKVAARMYLSPHTIDFHLRHIFRKLHVKSRVELTRLLLARS
jgi:DNA-binding CsgD family transcriptional regulator